MTVKTRILITAALALACLQATAQIAVREPSLERERRIEEMRERMSETLRDGMQPGGAADEMTAAELSFLLDRENALLAQRRTATILSFAGTAAMYTGAAFIGYGDSPMPQILTLGGGLTALGSGIWLLVNELQLISTRRDINGRMKAVLIPGGVALRF